MDRLWFEAAFNRAIKTIAQTAAATIGTAMALSEVDWRLVVSASILAGILSILTSFAGLPEVQLIQEQMEGTDDEEGEEVSLDELIAVLKEEDPEDDDIDEEDDEDDPEDPEDDEELPQ